MNITLTIEAPELVGAIESLALALGGTGLTLPVTAPKVETSDEKATKPEKDADVNKAAKEAADKEKAKKAAALKAKKEADEKAAQLAAEKAELAAKEEAEAEPEVQTISLDVVRGKLAALAAEGKPQQEKIQKALTSLKAKKLTDVDAKDYAKLLELCGVSE